MSDLSEQGLLRLVQSQKLVFRKVVRFTKRHARENSNGVATRVICHANGVGKVGNVGIRRRALVKEEAKQSNAAVEQLALNECFLFVASVIATVRDGVDDIAGIR